MIVGEQKSIAEIKELVAPFTKVLILGCGTCVKTCFAGGEDEVGCPSPPPCAWPLRRTVRISRSKSLPWSASAKTSSFRTVRGNWPQ